MKYVWLGGSITAAVLLALYVNAKTGAVAGLCIPPSYIVTHDITGTDANFDQGSDHNLATLMFTPKQMQQAVKTYNGTIRSSSGSELRQPLHVTLSDKAAKVWPFSEQNSRVLTGHDNLFTDTNVSEFSWQIHEKTPDGYQHWGSCMDDFNGGLGCFRQLRHNALHLTYTVEADNISLYPQIDEFLHQQLSSWQCQ